MHALNEIPGRLISRVRVVCSKNSSPEESLQHKLVCAQRSFANFLGLPLEYIHRYSERKRKKGDDTKKASISRQANYRGKNGKCRAGQSVRRLAGDKPTSLLFPLIPRYNASRTTMRMRLSCITVPGFKLQEEEERSRECGAQFA